jgi:hypothetical protein
MDGEDPEVNLWKRAHIYNTLMSLREPGSSKNG